MSAEAYFKQAVNLLQDIAAAETANIQTAATAIAQAIVDDHSIYAFGASHSFMVAEEMIYRTGGLMLVNPIYPHGMNLFVRPLPSTSQLERLEGLGQQLLDTVPLAAGDVVIVASTSGRNAVAIDLTLAAREQGAVTIGITSRAYTEGVDSRHSSGKKLIDIADIVIGNGAPFGDAAVTIEGFPDRVGPLSTVGACAVVNAIVAEVVQLLVDQEVTPPVYMSANVDGGDEHNAKLLKANAHRIHYLI